MKDKKVFLSLLFLLTSVLGLKAQESTHWQCDIHEYEYDMTVYFVLTRDGNPIADYTDYEVAAFVGEECRGVAEFQTLELSNGTTKKYGYIRIRSNQTNGESITFKAYMKPYTKEVTLEGAPISFRSMDIQGYPSTPMALELPEVLPGDVNNDGVIDVSDVVTVVNIILGIPASTTVKEVADVTGDGEIDVSDVVKIVNIILNKNV